MIPVLLSVLKKRKKNIEGRQFHTTQNIKHGKYNRHTTHLHNTHTSRNLHNTKNKTQGGRFGSWFIGIAPLPGLRCKKALPKLDRRHTLSGICIY